ncbi:MAG TPA: serine/threonine-protein kinase [Polyangia bacterium]
MRAPEQFEILAELGEGAFARVYRARAKASGKEAALKILKEGLAGDAEVVERFRREVFAVASIDSPHVIKLYDFGLSGADVFIAMEYVHGPTLRELLRGRSWSGEAVRVVVGQIAQALSAAHAQGIVHRDLKPENVMLVRSAKGRQVKVLDFGLAKLVKIESKLELEPLTQAGMCFGTPQYMAPEQMQGKPASQSADLFALGVMAYEMLTGRLPWDGGDPREVFRAIINTPPPPLPELHPSVERQRAALDRFFVDALAKKPEARPADATAFFAAFELAMFGRPRHTGPIFSAIISAELAAPEDIDPDTGVTDPFGIVPDPMPDLAAFEVPSTIPGKLGSVPPGAAARRLHSMWSMSLSTLPPLSPGAEDDAPLLAAPPVVRKSSKTTAPTNGELSVSDAAARAVEPRASAPAAPKRGGVPVAWVLVAAVCLVVVAALAGYFVGRAPR